MLSKFAKLANFAILATVFSAVSCFGQVNQYPAASSGGGGGLSSIPIQQAGVAQGDATTLNCVNLACSVANGTASISISTPTIDAQNNGSDLGQVFALNCGTNTACTSANGVVTITSSGSGGSSGPTYVTTNPSGQACTTGTGEEIWSSDPNGPSQYSCPAGVWVKTPALPTLALVGNHVCVVYANGTDTPDLCDTIIRTVTTTSDTLVLGDAQGVVNYNSASAVAVSVVAPTSLIAGTQFQIVNYGAGVVTLTPQGGNWQPNSAGTLQVPGGTASSPTYLSFYTDGTNFWPKALITNAGGGGGSVTASSIQSAITPLSGCNTAGNVWLPQSNTCVAQTGGTSVVSATPYIEIGSSYYIPSDSMSLATRPNGLTGFTSIAGSTATATITNQSNESTTFANDTGTAAWYAAPTPDTNSLELVATWNNTPGKNTSSGGGGIWVYDSTGGKLYLLKVTNDTGGTGGMTLAFQTWTYNGSSTPNFSTNGTAAMSPMLGRVHLKVAISGGNATFSYSTDGGVSFITDVVQAVGTIGSVGIEDQWGTLNVFSVSHN